MNELEKLEKAKQDIQDKIDKLNSEPKLNTPKLNKWYKVEGSNMLVFAQEYSSHNQVYGYGFWDDEWCDNNSESTWCDKDELIPATNEEVEAALIKEVKKRGFKKGAKFFGCHGAEKNKLIEIAGKGIKYVDKSKGHGLTGVYFKNSWIFYKGKWAKIVEESKVVINRHVMQVSLVNRIKFGCAIFCRNRIQELNEKIELFNSGVIEDDYLRMNRKIKSITLDSGVKITVKQLKEIVDNIK
jgi:hypothetical protein